MVRVSSTVRRRWREENGYTGILVKTRLEADAALALVEDVVASVETLAGLNDWLPVMQVCRTPTAPSLSLSKGGDLDRTLQMIAAELEVRGYADAVLAGLPIRRPLHGHGIASSPADLVGFVKAFIALRGRSAGLQGRRPLWDTSEDDASAALEYLVDWVLALPGVETAAHISTGHHFTPVLVRDALSPLRSVLKGHGPMSIERGVNLIAYAGPTFRSLQVDRARGEAVIAAGAERDHLFRWDSALPSVDRVVDEAGDWCSYAHLTRGFQCADLFQGASHGSVRRAVNRGYREDRFVVERDELFDAFGVMRLHRTFAERRTNLPRQWTVRPSSAEGDFVMIRHNQPEASSASHRLTQRYSRPRVKASERCSSQAHRTQSTATSGSKCRKNTHGSLA